MVDTKTVEAVIVKDAERVGEAAGAAFFATFIASSGELLSNTHWADLKVALISVIGAAASAAVTAAIVAVRQVLKAPSSVALVTSVVNPVPAVPAAPIDAAVTDALAAAITPENPPTVG